MPFGFFLCLSLFGIISFCCNFQTTVCDRLQNTPPPYRPVMSLGVHLVGKNCKGQEVPRPRAKYEVPIRAKSQFGISRGYMSHLDDSVIT